MILIWVLIWLCNVDFNLTCTVIFYMILSVGIDMTTTVGIDMINITADMPLIGSLISNFWISLDNLDFLFGSFRKTFLVIFGCFGYWYIGPRNMNMNIHKIHLASTRNSGRSFLGPQTPISIVDFSDSPAKISNDQPRFRTSSQDFERPAKISNDKAQSASVLRE